MEFKEEAAVEIIAEEKEKNNDKKVIKKKPVNKKKKELNSEDKKTYIVEAGLLNVRKGPGFNFDNIKFNEFTDEIKDRIISTFKKPKDAIAKGTTLNITEIQGDWGKFELGWVNLNFCKKLGE